MKRDKPRLYLIEIQAQGQEDLEKHYPPTGAVVMLAAVTVLMIVSALFLVFEPNF